MNSLLLLAKYYYCFLSIGQITLVVVNVSLWKRIPVQKKKKKYFRIHMLGCFLAAALNCVKQCRIYRFYFEAVADGVLWGSHCLCVAGEKELAISEWQGRQYGLLGCPKIWVQPQALSTLNHCDWLWEDPAKFLFLLLLFLMFVSPNSSIYEHPLD